MVLLAAHGTYRCTRTSGSRWPMPAEQNAAGFQRSLAGGSPSRFRCCSRAGFIDGLERKKKREGAAVSFLPPVLRMTETKDPDPPTRGTGPFGIHYCSDTRLRKRALGSCHHLARWRESAWVPRLRRWIDCSAKSKCACSELLAHQEWTRHVFFPLSSWSLALK